jgi:hypothetical protein
MLDNKTLRKSYLITQWVVVVNTGVEKFISNKYARKHDFDYTVLINKALRFNEKYLAERFIEQNNITGKVLPIKYSLELVKIE